MDSAETKQKKPRPYSKHGLTVLKRAVNGLGNRLIDKRTATGRALAEWRKDLFDDLGGPDAISAQQAAVIEIAVKSKLLLDSIDVWLLTQESLINKRKRSLLPIVMQRQSLADGLVKHMTALGLERKAAKTKTLSDWTPAEQDDQQEAATGADSPVAQPPAEDAPIIDADLPSIDKP